MSKEFKHEVQKLAVKRGVSVAQLIRDVLNYEVNIEKKKDESLVLKKLGLSSV